MKYEQLLLPATSTEQFSAGALDLLRKLPGVLSATRTPDSLELTVGFDEQLTSAGQLRAAIGLNGGATELARPGAKHAGGCCGACGG